MSVPWETRLPKRLRLTLTLVPIALTLAILITMYSLWSWKRVLALGTAAVAAFVYLGKFIILTPAVSEKVAFTPWELALLVIYLDICTGCVVGGNLGTLYRLPWIGERLADMEQYGRLTLSERPFMRRMATLGVVLFVMFPVTGTGAVGASILGRLLGLRIRRILLCISLGSAIGCGTLAAFSDLLAGILMPLRDDLWFQILGIGAILLLIGWFTFRAGRVMRKLEVRQADEGRDRHVVGS